MPGNTGYNLVDSIFSNTASLVGDIEKAWVHLYMGTYTILVAVSGFWDCIYIYIFKLIIDGFQF